MDETHDDHPLTNEQLGEISGGGNFTPSHPTAPGQSPAPPQPPSGGGDGGGGSSVPNPNAPPPTPGGIG